MKRFLKTLPSWKVIIENIYLNILQQHIEQMPGYEYKLEKIDIWKIKSRSC